MKMKTAYQSMQDIITAGATPMQLLRVTANLRLQTLERHLKTISDNKIMDGTFKGVMHAEKAFGSVLSPKILGTYEAELVQEIMPILQGKSCFLDIGCAQGYYTTGVAVKSDIPKVIGVDINAAALTAAKNNAALNGVDHKCDFFAQLADAIDDIGSNPLIMVDVDGDELTVLKGLFEKCQDGKFNTLTMVIETDYWPDHSSNKDDIVDELLRHDFQITKIIEQDIRLRFSAISKRLTRSYLDQALLGLEGRPNDQCWVIATRPAGGS